MARDLPDAPWVIATPSSPGAPELRELIGRNQVAHRWLDPGSDPLVRLLGAAERLDRPLPLIVLPDGRTIEPPSAYQDARPGLDAAAIASYGATARWRAEVAAGLGLKTKPDHDQYDVLIVGGGPAGLTAAVYAASEGLRTLLIERIAPGGQAGTSARIENYPGFTHGITGAELAAAAHEQALRFGAEVLVGVETGHVTPELETMTAAVELTSGATIRTRTAVVAPGVAYRRLDAPGVEALMGRGVYYGSAPAEALRYEGGEVAVVGAANSAGQAVLHLAPHARRVNLLVRGDSLQSGMSNYLVERIRRCPNVDVRLNTRVTRAEGDERLEALTVCSGETAEERLVADTLFVLIGGIR